MSQYDFWHGDMRLLEAYQKAYYKNNSFTAWKNGSYVCVAVSTALCNAFKKKGERSIDYPKYDDTIDKLYKHRITDENLEEEFRETQIQQNEWLHSILNKKEDNNV